MATMEAVRNYNGPVEVFPIRTVQRPKGRREGSEKGLPRSEEQAALTAWTVALRKGPEPCHGLTMVSNCTLPPFTATMVTVFNGLWAESNVILPETALKVLFASVSFTFTGSSNPVSLMA